MTDIVARLRAPRPDLDPLSSLSDMAEVDRQRREAADEIERLRKALREIANNIVTVSTMMAIHEMRQTAREALRHD